MKSAVENIEPTRVKLSVEVTYDELKPSLEAAYRTIGQQVSIPGFRKGKVPPRIIDQRVGRGAVLEQAINDALPGLYRDAVTEADLNVLGQPDVEVTGVPADADGQLTFTAEVDVRPQFELPALDGIAVEVDDVEVTDEELDARIDVLRQRFGTLTGVERAAAEGDFLVLDLAAAIDGAEIDSVSSVSYQVGSGTMLEGLDGAVLGLSAGDSTTFTAPLAGGDNEGQPADVTVTISAVKEQELPELDDDFAELASEFDTLEELKDDLRAQIGGGKVEQQAVQARDRLVEKLVEATDFPLPAGVIEAEIHRHLEGEGRLEDADHREEVREDATTALRKQLLLDALADSLDVQVSREELVEFLLRTAQQYQVDPNEFITNADRTGQIPVFVGELARNKSVALALRKVAVTDTAGSAVDLSDYIGSDETDAQIAADAEASDVEVTEADEAEVVVEDAEADAADEADDAVETVDEKA